MPSVKTVDFFQPGVNSASLWSMKELPLTEIFGPFDVSFPAFDQELLIDLSSGHTSLRYQLDPEFLYNSENYAFRTGMDQKTISELDFFTKFISTLGIISPRGQKSRALEFGASNLVLARLLSSGFDEVVAVDPLLSGVEKEKSEQNIVVSGLMLEQHLRRDFELNDVIVARHTFEHVSDPVEILIELAQRLKPQGKIVFEVPDLDAIVAKGRFDAVFHQHFHYYDLDSLNYFASVSGLRVVAWARNAAGSNGGSLIVALEKGQADFVSNSARVNSKIGRILKALELFQKMYSVMEENAKEFRGPRYVYGAGIMLPTFDYHMNGAVRDIGVVVDDDEAKIGLSFKNLPVDVVHTSSIDSYEKSMLVVGSLENVRSMAGGIRALRPLVALGPSIY